MKKTFWSALMPVLALTISSCSSEPEQVAAPNPNNTQIVDAYQYSSDEKQLIDVLNDYRESIGLNRLETIGHISVIARSHNAYMIALMQLNHDGFDARAHDLSITQSAQKVAENVARNFTTAAPLLQAWLESPGHRANIEGDFTHFGLSISIDATTGKKYCTNIFMKR